MFTVFISVMAAWVLVGCSCSEVILEGNPDPLVEECGNGIIEAGEECDDANETDWDGCNSCTIAEFLVNSTTEGYQQTPDVSVSPDGRIVVAWVGDAVFGQLYGRDGFRHGTEFSLSERTDLTSPGVHVAMLDDGRFVGAWAANWAEDFLTEIVVRWFSPEAVPTGPEVRVDQRYRYTYVGPAPAVTILGDDRSVLVWEDLNEPGRSFRGGACEVDASSMGSEFSVILSSTADYHVRPCVEAAIDDSIVVVWQSMEGDGDSWGILGQRLDISGSRLGSTFLVNTSTEFEQSKPAIAVSVTGRIVVVWEGRLSGAEAWGIYGQLFEGDGTPVGSEILVNERPNGSQSYTDVAIDAEGGFVVAWDSSGPGDTAYDIAVRRFDEDGNPVGAEFKANLFTESIQSEPAIAMTADGRFVVAWKSKEQLGGEREFNIFAQRYAASGNPLGTLPW